MHTKRIAIIGAGVSGLSAAYELAQQALAQSCAISIDIFERDASLGGNAKTAAFSLGHKQGVPSPDNNIEYIRWADLGVNDINLSAYTTVKEVMEHIGYLDESLPRHQQTLLPLENSECYFSLDGTIAYTDDEDIQQGVIDPNHSLQHVNGGYLKYFSELIYKAALKEIYPDGKDKPENIETTCEQFFDDCVASPKQRLEEFAKQTRWYDAALWEDPAWLARASTWVATLRDNVFYPRISAMYFTNDYGPEKMLLAAPFHYYSIQESVGDETPKRRYFVGGSQKWLEYLANYLIGTLAHDNADINIVIRQAEAHVSVLNSGVEVRDSDNNLLGQYDDVVITTHADDAARLLTFETDDRQHEGDIRRILSSISYTSSIAVCHTWSGLLPPNRNLWRAYNVLIRHGESLKPYSMTYVCNRHQNDVSEPTYNLYGLPQFFVTLNPQLPIPDDQILRKVPRALIPRNIQEQLPEQTLEEASLISSGKTGDRAIAKFKHNLIDRACFLAQRELLEYHSQEAPVHVYFGGGWSRGSGLHEECWLQSRDIAKRIMNA